MTDTQPTAFRAGYVIATNPEPGYDLGAAKLLSATPIADTQPLSAEELEHWRDWLTRDVPKLARRLDVTITQLQAQVSEIAKQALSYEGEARQLMQDRDHWKERAEKAEANQRTPGTVEVCPRVEPDGKCWRRSWRPYVGVGTYCQNTSDCPIRQETER